MRKLLNYDGKIMIFLRRIADLIILNTLWVVCCIPVVTIGPATSALYYVMIKMIRREETRILRMYMHSFRENLVQGVGITLLFAMAGLVLLLDYFLIAIMSGVFQVLLTVTFLILGLFFLFTLVYTFPLQAQFTNTVHQTLKNAWYMSFQYPGNTIIVVILNILPIAFFLFCTKYFLQFLPLWLFLAPASIAYLCSKGFVRIFDSLIESQYE